MYLPTMWIMKEAKTTHHPKPVNSRNVHAGCPFRDVNSYHDVSIQFRTSFLPPSGGVGTFFFFPDLLSAFSIIMMMMIVSSQGRLTLRLGTRRVDKNRLLK